MEHSVTRCSSQVKRLTDFGRTCERHRQGQQNCHSSSPLTSLWHTGSFVRQESFDARRTRAKANSRVSGEDRVTAKLSPGRGSRGSGYKEGRWSGKVVEICLVIYVALASKLSSTEDGALAIAQRRRDPTDAANTVVSVGFRLSATEWTAADYCPKVSVTPGTNGLRNGRALAEGSSRHQRL